MEEKKMKSLAILSHKGGVGKTSVAVNLAYQLASTGSNVCLLDNDFHGPSILTFFKPKPETNWINEYLLGSSSLNSCLQEVGSDLNLQGKLFVAFADPTPESVANIIQLDSDTSMKMLHFLMQLKKTLKEDPYNIDYLIVDSSPGVGMTTLNLMVVCKATLFMVKLNNADINGAMHMIEGLHRQLKNRTLILANQIPERFFIDDEKKKHFQELIEALLEEKLGERVVEFLGWIPNDLELFTSEFETALKTLEGLPANRVIYVRDKPDHVVTSIINDIAPKLFEDDE